MRQLDILNFVLAAVLALSGCGTTKEDRVPALGPSIWVADDVQGKGLVDGSHLTLVFGADGRVSGSSGCNKFTGAAETDGKGLLTLDPLSATRRACAPALLNQESNYLAALDAAQRYNYDGTDFLLIYSRNAPVPTRFRADAPTGAIPEAIKTRFQCTDGTALAVTFDTAKGIARVERSRGVSLVLAAHPTGSGYYYTNGPYGLSGKGAEAQWFVGRKLPLRCTELS